MVAEGFLIGQLYLQKRAQLPHHPWNLDTMEAPQRLRLQRFTTTS
jgi:hypothetical protein